MIICHHQVWFQGSPVFTHELQANSDKSVFLNVNKISIQLRFMQLLNKYGLSQSLSVIFFMQKQTKKKKHKRLQLCKALLRHSSAF